jgi:hypothetical protein
MCQEWVARLFDHCVLCALEMYSRSIFKEDKSKSDFLCFLLYLQGLTQMVINEMLMDSTKKLHILKGRKECFFLD